MKLNKHIILSFLMLFIVITKVNTQAPPDIQKYPPIPDKYYSDILKTKSRLYALKNVNIIPMNIETVFRNYTVLVKEGQIQKIGLSSQIHIPSNFEIIDGKEKYLIPGLIDMHVHFFIQNDLLLFVANGITTVRNMMGNQEHLKIKDKLRKNIIFGPNLYTTGPYITNLNNLNQIKTIVPDSKKSGFDFLKIYGFLSDECYREIMKQSRIYDIKAIGHLPYNGGLKAAIEEKQYSIEHIQSLITNDFSLTDSIDTRQNIENKLKIIAQSGTWLCHTHSPVVFNKNPKKNEDFLKNSQYRYINPVEFMIWYGNPSKEFLYDDLVKETIKKFLDLKGKFILGTDCGTPFIMPGFSFHEQLNYLVSSGFTPYQALRAGTYNAADCLGILDKSGTIEEGKIADLVLLNGNPLENINITRKIEGVMLKGNWFPQNELQEMMEYLSNYHKEEINSLFTQSATLPDEVKDIYFADYKLEGTSYNKSRVIFGIIVLIMIASGLFIAFKIKQKNK
jgi:imidazolonepropionase-like amidohydrolase